MRNRGLVMTRERLLDTVWGIDFPGGYPHGGRAYRYAARRSWVPGAALIADGARRGLQNGRQQMTRTKIFSVDLRPGAGALLVLAPWRWLLDMLYGVLLLGAAACWRSPSPRRPIPWPRAHGCPTQGNAHCSLHGPWIRTGHRVTWIAGDGDGALRQRRRRRRRWRTIGDREEIQQALANGSATARARTIPTRLPSGMVYHRPACFPDGSSRFALADSQRTPWRLLTDFLPWPVLVLVACVVAGGAGSPPGLPSRTLVAAASFSR